MKSKSVFFKRSWRGAAGASALALGIIVSLTGGGACSSGGGKASPDAAAGTGGAQGSLYGRVSVQLKEEEGYTDFAAAFRDGVFPPASDKGALMATMTSGGCRLLVPVACTPSCDASQWCTAKDQCTPKSSVINAGELTLTGLGDAGTIAVAPQGNVYAISPTPPFPGCRAGASVTAKASSFMVSAPCIAPLAVTTAAPVQASAGHSIELAWAAPGQAGSRVEVAVEISHHGGFKGEIDCDVPDNGSLSIPEPLVTALNGLGRAGYPTISLTRVSTGTASTQTNVALEISSTVVLAADTGVVSCGGNQDCTPPATCQPSRICQ